jgi:hypothetical protein
VEVGTAKDVLVLERPAVLVVKKDGTVVDEPIVVVRDGRPPLKPPPSFIPPLRDCKELPLDARLVKDNPPVIFNPPPTPIASAGTALALLIATLECPQSTHLLLVDLLSTLQVGHFQVDEAILNGVPTDSPGLDALQAMHLVSVTLLLI